MRPIPSRLVLAVLAALALLVPAVAVATQAPPGQDEVTRSRTPIAFIPAAVLGIDFSVKSPGGPHFDPAALTGTSWALFTNGYIAQSYDNGQGELMLATIRAKGDPLGGIGPHMTLIVDGVPIAAWEVPPEYRTFQVAFRLGSNHPHSVAVAFTNDDIVPNPAGGQHIDDRNLIVDWVAVTPLPPGVALPPTVTVQPVPQVAPFAGVGTIPVVPVEIGPQVIVVPQPTPQQPDRIVQTTVVNVNQQQRQTIVNNVQNTVVNNVNVDVSQEQVQVEQQPAAIPGATAEERERAVDRSGNLTVQTREGPQQLEDAAQVDEGGIQVEVTPTPPGQQGTPPGQQGEPPGQQEEPPGQQDQPPGDGPPEEPPADVVTPGEDDEAPPGEPPERPPGDNVTPPPNETNVTNVTNVTPPGEDNVTNVTNETNVTPHGPPPAEVFDVANATILACDNGTEELAALDGQCLARSNVTAENVSALAPTVPPSPGGPGANATNAANVTNATNVVVTPSGGDAAAPLSPVEPLNVTYALVDFANASLAAENKTGVANVTCDADGCNVTEPFPVVGCPDCAVVSTVALEDDEARLLDVRVERLPRAGGIV